MPEPLVEEEADQVVLCDLDPNLPEDVEVARSKARRLRTDFGERIDPRTERLPYIIKHRKQLPGAFLAK